MSIEREDGPTKHYRYVCDRCGKQSKRGVEDLPDVPNWKTVENDPDDPNCHDEYSHYCPKCAGAEPQEAKEIITKNGSKFDVSDHESVYRPVIRKDAHTLVIDMKEAGRLVITSNTAIKVVHEEA